MTVRTVYVGEPVVVRLVERAQGRRGNEAVGVSGVVTGFDARGINVQLDCYVNGIDTCYATYEEVNHRRKADA